MLAQGRAYREPITPLSKYKYNFSTPAQASNSQELIRTLGFASSSNIALQS